MESAYINYINELRKEEMRRVFNAASNYFDNKDVLEIGSGTGIQLQQISQLARTCVGLEIPDGGYTSFRQANIVDFDGENIPCPDSSFDTVFSSNVIEHVRNQPQINTEIKRVLRSSGQCVHVVPTASWRFLTSLLHWPGMIDYRLRKRAKRNGTVDGTLAKITNKEPFLLRLWKTAVPEKHGEIGNWLTEYFYFSVSAWKHRFESLGWQIELAKPMGLAYTGHQLFGPKLTMQQRTALARYLGSSTVLFVMKRQENS
jgi:SAM-dependent methyltransferase